MHFKQCFQSCLIISYVVLQLYQQHIQTAQQSIMLDVLCVCVCVCVCVIATLTAYKCYINVLCLHCLELCRRFWSMTMATIMLQYLKDLPGKVYNSWDWHCLCIARHRLWSHINPLHGRHVLFIVFIASCWGYRDWVNLLVGAFVTSFICYNFSNKVPYILAYKSQNLRQNHAPKVRGATYPQVIK